MKKSKDDIRESESKFFNFWNVEKEEQWLTQKALDGHVIERIEVSLFGFKKYFFRQEVARKCSVRMDYKKDSGDLQTYYDIFRESGWKRILVGVDEAVSTQSKWRYFIKESDGEDIYTNEETRAELQNRLLVISMVIVWIGITFRALLANPIVPENLAQKVFCWFADGLVVYGGWGLVNLSVRIWKSIRDHGRKVENELSNMYLKTIRYATGYKDGKFLTLLILCFFITLVAGIFLISYDFGYIVGYIAGVILK